MRLIIMKHQPETINPEWLTRMTGDPFADVGGLVIKYLYEKSEFKDQDILGLIKEVSNIYVKNWGGKINAFFLNSTVTQPAFKGDRKTEETFKYYTGLINETRDFVEGYCRITGQETHLFLAGRDNHILSGSGTFVNFHHHLEDGIYLSKEVIIRMFFVPFGLLQLGNKIALVYSNHEKVSEFFVYDNCQANMQGVSSGISETVLKSEFRNPSNALFAFADRCITNLELLNIEDEDDDHEDIDITLNLYHFTNFGASPEVVLHILPATVFRFYAYCQNPKYKKAWTQFIRSYYRNAKFKNAVFNEDTEIWEGKKENASYESYKVWSNIIYDKLLNEQSILIHFLKWSVTHSFPFKIVENYLIKLRNMDKKTIEKIKHLADFIVIDRDDDFIKKHITRLNGAKNGHTLRRIFLNLIAQNNKEDTTEPLITVEDYVNYLFPDAYIWREVRDVLLIAIYQKLHEIAKKIEVEPNDEDLESINENE